MSATTLTAAEFLESRTRAVEQLRDAEAAWSVVKTPAVEAVLLLARELVNVHVHVETREALVAELTAARGRAAVATGSQGRRPRRMAGASSRAGVPGDDGADVRAMKEATMDNPDDRGENDERKNDRLTTHEIAALLDVNSSSVVRWIDSGKMKSHETPGGHRRVFRRDLEAFSRKFNYPLAAASPPSKTETKAAAPADPTSAPNPKKRAPGAPGGSR